MNRPTCIPANKAVGTVSCSRLGQVPVQLGKRLLIVNPFGIGDVLFTTPMIEQIKNSIPDAYIGYICNIRTAPVISANPDIDDLYIYEKDEYRYLWKISKTGCIKAVLRFFGKIRSEAFDTALDLSMAQEFGLFLAMAGIKNRIGYNFRNRGIFLTKKIDLKGGFKDMHIADYYLRLLGLAGIEPKTRPRLKVYITDEDSKKADIMLAENGISANDGFICIAPGGGASWGKTSFRKHWPKENFAQLAKILHADLKAEIVLLGSENESELCSFIKEKNPFCINLCGRTSLLSCAAVLKRSKLVITNDGGLLHIAVGVGAKTVSIFGPVDEKIYGPFPAGKDHAVVTNSSLSCRPCYGSFKLPECAKIECLNSIGVESVAKIAMDMAH